LTKETEQLFEEKRRRIRRIKRWLRPLPRRSNLHRYPVLSWFKKTARKRIYLWSFRPEHAAPALQFGCILTLLPIYGLQLPLAFLLALLLRGNLPIFAGLQLISNPFTVLPIWYALYQIGRQTLSIFNIETMRLGKDTIAVLIQSFTSWEWGDNFESLITVFGITSLGALIVGTFFGVISSFIYRIIANRMSASYALLHAKLEKLRNQISKANPDNPNV
jgi:uncharacterized protein (DUF2062 family)